MPELDDLPSIDPGDISNDDYLLVFDVGGDVAGKVTKAQLLSGLAKTGQAANFSSSTINTLTAPTFNATNIRFAAGGQDLRGVFRSVESVEFTGSNANDKLTKNVTITGVAVNDAVMVNFNEDVTDPFILRGRVTAADTVEVTIIDPTGSTELAATYSLVITVIRTS